MRIWKQHWVLERPMQDTVDATFRGAHRHDPEGLYLLTSVALAREAAMRLARRKGADPRYELHLRRWPGWTLSVWTRPATITESATQADDPLPPDGK